MLADVPITRASVLVALADLDEIPKKSSVGKVIIVPPPATALIAPPAAAASTRPMISITGICGQSVNNRSVNSSFASPNAILLPWSEGWRAVRRQLGE